MKKILFSLYILTGITSGSFCQENLNISDLFIPSAPGFVLADKAPSSIEKPTTPKTFGVSLLNLWQGGAVEATPFWFTNKPLFTYEAWIKKKVTIAETFNISIATFKTDTTSTLSGGFRTQVFRIYPKTYIKKILDQEEKVITALTTLDADGNIDLEKVKKESDELDKLEAKGFVAMEIAAAINGSSKTNSFENLQSEKSGVWANFRWSPDKGLLDFVALVRYSWTNNANAKSGKDSAFFDYGIAANYESNNFNISFEYVNRRDFSIQKNYDRLCFTAIYQLNKNIALVASLGKNFDKVDNIITVFGLNFGIANQKVNPSE